MVAICNSYLCKLCFFIDLNKNLTLKKDNLFSFSSLNRFFALSLDKIGCISTKKIKVFGLLFCFVFDLNKNLTLKKDNLFSFSSLNRFFALSLLPNCGHITPATVRKTWVHI